LQDRDPGGGMKSITTIKRLRPGSPRTQRFECAVILSLTIASSAIGLAQRRDAATGDQPAPISVLSSRADLVTGAEALIRIAPPRGIALDRVRVFRNGTEITAAFRRGTDGTSLIGLVTELPPGTSQITVGSGAGAATLSLVSYPVSGPVFSGPHEMPFICETDRFEPRAGGTLGKALDADCSVATRVDYLYRSTQGGALKPLPRASRPEDLAEVTTSTGARAPYIVRVETGTINRAVYEIAMLHDPAEPVPDFLTKSRGWNGRLVYTFGGGCPGGWYRQGRNTGGVEDDAMLRQGYAIASATLNVFGNNCNDLLAAETMMMVKERFVEAYGPPLFTIGWGCSGGSYQVHQIADNYPGLLDGIIAGCSFPDVGHAAISAHSFGARLLHHYFESTPEAWTDAQKVAASGLPDLDSLVVQGTRPDRINPRGVCDQSLPVNLLYDPTSNPRGTRCTVYDHTVNVYGRDPKTGFARRLLDNVGVQYGLAALNDRTISVGQFLDLNEKIGGVDLDANFISQRTVADKTALRIAYESGRILSGGGGLASTPVIDYRGYSDFNKGDPHMRFFSFATRARLAAANGRTDNHVMLIEDGASYGLFSTRSPLAREALAQMDRWLSAVAGDASSDSRAVKVVRDKPADLVDLCIDKGGKRITEVQHYQSGACHELYPSHASPYLVAGMPLASNVLKCQLKPVTASDYRVPMSRAETERLRAIFPDGVCDYSKPGVEQRPLAGTWLSFGPSPQNRIATN
jgi:hypothetical protein